MERTIMEKDVYEKLRELLDLHPFGCPPAPEIIEILKILFTENEAKVALGLAFRPFLVEEIAARAGVDPQATKERLESLADKGLVFARQKEGVWGYALFDILRIFENPLRKGSPDETTRKPMPFWKDYWPKYTKKFQTPTAIGRVIPIQERIETNPGVLVHDRLYELIDRAKVVGIAHCACRQLIQKCDAPREACMVFDETCTFLVDRGFAKYLSKEALKQKAREFNEAGLVLQINNTRKRLDYICNCCPCCCGFLMTLRDVSQPRIITRSAFIPVWEMTNCQGCGRCAEERCPMKAIMMGEGKPIFQIERCIGCGLCVSGCPNNAIYLEKDATVADPPADILEMGMQMLQARGKFEDFIKVMTPTTSP
jgi:Fe-S-cluster-containing hydrogenase component 2